LALSDQINPSDDRRLAKDIQGLFLCLHSAVVMSGKQAAKGAGVKGKKAAKGGAEEKREDVLQAVVCHTWARSYRDTGQELTSLRDR
jgi:hypothetical protein